MLPRPWSALKSSFPTRWVRWTASGLAGVLVGGMLLTSAPGVGAAVRNALGYVGGYAFGYTVDGYVPTGCGRYGTNVTTLDGSTIRTCVSKFGGIGADAKGDLVRSTGSQNTDAGLALKVGGTTYLPADTRVEDIKDPSTGFADFTPVTIDKTAHTLTLKAGTAATITQTETVLADGVQVSWQVHNLSGAAIMPFALAPIHHGLCVGGTDCRETGSVSGTSPAQVITGVSGVVGGPVHLSELSSAPWARAEFGGQTTGSAGFSDTFAHVAAGSLDDLFDGTGRQSTTAAAQFAAIDPGATVTLAAKYTFAAGRTVTLDEVDKGPAVVRPWNLRLRVVDDRGVASVPIHYAMTGKNAQSGTVTTDASGVASLSLSGTQHGISTLNLSVDRNANGIEDLGDTVTPPITLSWGTGGSRKTGPPGATTTTTQTAVTPGPSTTTTPQQSTTPVPPPSDPVTPGPAPAPPPAPAADTTAPRLTLTVSPAKLAAALKGGLVVSVLTDEAASVRGTLSIGAKAARKLKLGKKALSVGTVTGATVAGTKRTLTLHLTGAAARKLAHVRKVSLTLTLVGTDAAGNAATVTKTLTLRR